VVMRYVYLYLLVAGGVVALVLVPIFRRLSFKLGVLDRPRPGRIHTRETALLGGMAVLAALLAVVIAHYAGAQLGASRWLPEDIQDRVEMYMHPGGLRPLLVLLIGAIAIALVGLVDDARGLAMGWRLVGEVIVAFVVVALGLRFELLFLPAPLAWAVAVLWIVGIANAFNFIDSMDGLAAGVGAIASALLGVFAGLSGQPILACLLFALAGVLVGFLRYNYAPASIFLGSSGSLLVGYLLSVTVLQLTFMREGTGFLPLAIPLLILAVPLYDMLSVILIRLVRHRKPWKADLNHLAHRLHRMGLSRRQTVLLVWLLTLALGVNAVLLAPPPVDFPFDPFKYYAPVVLVLQVFAVVGVLVVLEWTAFRGRRAAIATRLAAEWRLLDGEGGEETAGCGQVHRLGPGGASIEFDGSRGDAAGAFAASRRVEVGLLFEGGIEPVRLSGEVESVSLSPEGRLLLGVRFDALSRDERERLDFALTFYRSFGEG